MIVLSAKPTILGDKFIGLAKKKLVKKKKMTAHYIIQNEALHLHAFKNHAA